MKTIDEIKAAYKKVFGCEPKEVKDQYACFYIRDPSAYENARVADIIKFCKLLGTDNMRFDFETEEIRYSSWTADTICWRELYIYKDYWGWKEDQEND